MWGRSGDPIYENLSITRKNDFWQLPEDVLLISDLDKALGHSDYIFVIISAQGMRSFSKEIAKTLQNVFEKYIDENPSGVPNCKTFVLCMKGIDEQTNQTLTQTLRDAITDELSSVNEHLSKICVWVGPGHIQEFLEGQPGVMLVDGEDKEIVQRIATEFRSDTMKLYVGDDLIGAEIGAAAKNVLGIAAGILDGSGMPSLKGALMARGVYEVSKLVQAMGGKQLTAYGLSHLGDFEATLFSHNSHNRRFGEELIKLITENNWHGPNYYRGYLAEGVATSIALQNLAKKYSVSMPICDMVYKVIHEKKDPFTGFKELFLRDNVNEFGEN